MMGSLQKPLTWFILASVAALAGYAVTVALFHRPLAHVITPMCFAGVLLFAIQDAKVRKRCGIGLIVAAITFGTASHFMTRRVIIVDNLTDMNLPVQLSTHDMFTRYMMPANYEITVTFHIWGSIDPSLVVIDRVPDDPPGGLVTYTEPQLNYRVEREAIPGGYKLTIDGPVPLEEMDPALMLHHRRAPSR